MLLDWNLPSFSPLVMLARGEGSCSLTTAGPLLLDQLGMLEEVGLEALGKEEEVRCEGGQM